MTRHAALLLTSLAARCDGLGSTPPGVLRQPVVFGTDERHEVFDEPDAGWRALAQQSIAAVLPGAA